MQLDSPSLKAAANTPRTMRAAVLTAPRKIELREVSVPAPAANQVLVRLEGCGVCTSNIPPWEGRAGACHFAPALFTEAGGIDGRSHEHPNARSLEDHRRGALADEWPVLRHRH